MLRLRCVDGKHVGQTTTGPGGDGEECTSCYHSLYEGDAQYEAELDKALEEAARELQDGAAVERIERLKRIKEKERAYLELEHRKRMRERG